MVNEIVNANCNIINDIKSLVNKARSQAYAAVNQAMVEAYFGILGSALLKKNNKVRSEQITVSICSNYCL